MDLDEASPWADSADSSQPATSQPDSNEAPTQASEQSTGASTSNLSTSAPRVSRATTPRRLVAQSTKLEAVDDPLGPLGGAPSAGESDRAGARSDGDAPPAPPSKEGGTPVPIRTTMPRRESERRGPADPHRIDDDDDDDDGGDGRSGMRPPPPVQAAVPSSLRSSTLPSVSLEQAAKPTFQISVGDPAKVGDLTSSHIVYSVRTKVCCLWCGGFGAWLMGGRLRQRRTSSQSLRSVVGTGTFCGYITRCTRIVPGWWCRRRPRSRPWDALIRISSRAGGRLWRRC